MEFKQLEAFVAVVEPDPANDQFPYPGIRKRTEFPSAHPYHQTDESYRPWNAAL